MAKIYLFDMYYEYLKEFKPEIFDQIKEDAIPGWSIGRNYFSQAEFNKFMEDNWDRPITDLIIRKPD